MERIIFYFIAAIILGFSVLTVVSRKILRAATALLFVLIGTAAFYFFLNYNFLGAVQLTVYSGGIVVLIVFAVLLTAHMEHKLDPVKPIRALGGGILAILGASVTIYALSLYPFESNGQAEAPYDVEAIGLKLLSYSDYGYVLPFEVISILLLAAMVAAIIIAKKSVSND